MRNRIIGKKKKINVLKPNNLHIHSARSDLCDVVILLKVKLIRYWRSSVY